ncbi:MAG: hypothetical protein JJE25_11355 [Bacteroidia bacterium]|nr:hypothetical protein [Bacteroidia bacterium]
MKKIIYSALIILLLLNATDCKSQWKERYLVTNSGYRMDIDTFLSVSADTLSFVSWNKKSIILLDSVAEYNYKRPPGKVWTGLIIGVVAGGLGGAIIAGSVGGSIPGGVSAGQTGAVGLIGVLLGGAIGAAIGSSLKNDLTEDLRKKTRDEKRLYFQEVIHWLALK